VVAPKKKAHANAGTVAKEKDPILRSGR